MPFQAYISGALTDVPDSDATKQFYEDLGRAFEEVARGEFCIDGAVAYIPHEHGDPVKHFHLSPAQVKQMDRLRVRESRVMVMVTTYPSHGTGREHEWALADGTPIIALSLAERLAARKISRLARDDVSDQIAYTDHAHGIEEFKVSLRKLLRERFRSELPIIASVR